MDKRQEGTKLLTKPVFVIPAFRLCRENGDCQLYSGATVRIGSANDNSLVLSGDTVSRRHCEIRFEAGGTLLRDLHSTNGTFVNGVRVKEAWLEGRCELRLGEMKLDFQPCEERFVPEALGQERLDGLIGASEVMQTLFSCIRKMAACDLPLLIQGETGAGKELVAKALHRFSPRSGGPFVVVDCTCLPSNLVESELFGHRKGTFTGAIEGRVGLLELAEGGTVFFDEIGELPAEVQPKLLRVLENRELRPLGAECPRAIDVRVIAATNRDLRKEVAAGRFRKDLLFRLEGFRLEVPPLRQRTEDIPLLAEYFLERGGLAGSLEFAPEAMAALLKHPWPGNVRELMNVVTRAATMASGRRIRPSDLALSPADDTGTPSGRFRSGKEDAGQQFEREFLRELMRRFSGNVSRAAKDAGMDRKHLRKLLTKHGLAAGTEDE